MHCKTLAALPLLLLALILHAPADSPGIHTDRQSSKILPLPKGDDVFHFIVFGDRTGGPAEGIKVLAQAVEDANLLDPDLVMTVGDLINGYNQTGAWMKQMEEFQATMGKLKMPWFPVAGNHDIYWRQSSRNPEPKPPREHEDNYEKHFGPLWYWFEHKQCGFLVIFSDEGHPDGRQRNFSDHAQQQISQRQMDWIAGELEKMKPLRHVFVFLHHPFWWNERYPSNNWNAVHQLLVKNGNVRAVLAGHIHQMRYDGVRDGIAYYALATTGGSLTPGMEYQYFGLLHHFNVVTVRDSGFSMASLPVGGVFDPKQFTPERLAEVEAARYLMHEFVSPPILVNLDGSATATCQIRIENPCTLPIDVTILGKGDQSWIVAPDHRHAQVEPGETKVFDFACVREGASGSGARVTRPSTENSSGGANSVGGASPTSTSNLDTFEAPEFELRFDVLTPPNARLAMPHRSLRAQAALAPGWPAASTNGSFVFDGKAACLEIAHQKLTLPDGPFTVEAWVKPAADKDGAIVSNMKIGGFSLDVGGAPRFSVQTDERSVNERNHANLRPAVSAKAADKLAVDRWHHLAGVFDGSRITLFVNGSVAASTNVTGARLSSDKSLFIGARPNPAWNVYNISYPQNFWQGAIDDVRVSRGARYMKKFAPTRRLAVDASTLLAASNDQRFGPFVPVSAAASDLQAIVKGNPLLRHEL